MKVTSYFIGLEVRSQVLADLFVDLYEYFDECGCLDIVEFQNPLSVHITLYYLDKLIDEKLVQDGLRDVEGKFELDELGDFDGQIFYLTGAGLDGLKTEFERYKVLFSNEVLENGLEFVPHVTLFRVLDKKSFEGVRKGVVLLVKDFLGHLGARNASEGRVSLYKVNSSFRPELQVKIG